MVNSALGRVMFFQKKRKRNGRRIDQILIKQNIRLFTYIHDNLYKLNKYFNKEGK